MNFLIALIKITYKLASYKIDNSYIKLLSYIPSESVQWCAIVTLTAVVHSSLMEALYPLITNSTSSSSLKFKAQLNS